MAEVAVEELYKIFPDHVVAVDGVSFHVRDRGFLTLLGPSGCGKSTILRLIAGLEKPSSGKVYVDGRLVNDQHPADRDVAMVFQSYALYPHMNCFDNMAVHLKLRKVPREEIQRRTRETARLLGIENLLHRKPKALSGGQRQRVALGRAIVRQPKAFLLDEPLSNLDAILRERMRGDLKALFSAMGATVIYVTHDQVEAMTMSDTIAVVRAGKIQQIGSPAEIYHNPANVFVAQFVGSPRMNFLRCTIESGRLTFGRHDLPLPRAVVSTVGLPANVLVGIRPEHLTVLREARPGALEAQADLCEPLGAFTILHLRLGENAIAALVTPEDAQMGGRRWVEFHGGKIHLFDPATEERLKY